MMRIIGTVVESTTAVIESTEQYLQLPSLDLLPLQYYIDELTGSVTNVVNMMVGLFNHLPDWVPIIFGISFSMGVGFYVINKLSG